MRKLCLSVLTLCLCAAFAVVSAKTHAQQNVSPPAGPILYSQPIRGTVIFQDVGTDEVWEIDGNNVVEAGLAQSWSPNGCHLLYGNNVSRAYAIIDPMNRTLEPIDILNNVEMGSQSSIEGRPVWSPDGNQLAFSLIDGSDSQFWSYNVNTGDTERLYTRAGYEGGWRVSIRDWTSDNQLIYSVDGHRFSLDLPSREVRYQPREAVVSPPVREPFHWSLASPNNEVTATFFDLSGTMGMTDIRFSYFNDEEMGALRRVIDPKPGITFYFAQAGKASTFDLDQQTVSAAVWSPDGSKMAIHTWPSDNYATATGSYIYDARTDVIKPLPELQAVRHTDPIEYGFYQPSWSTDGQWVTLYGRQQGWVIYHLETEVITPLARQFQDSISILKVDFSPVTHYRPNQCD